MLQFPRILARQFRAVLRRSVLDQQARGSWPPIFCHSGEHGLLLQAHRGEVVLCYHDPLAQPAGSLAFPGSLLAEIEGRGEQPIEFERLGPDKARVCWTDSAVPRAVEFEPVPMEDEAAFPPLPREWTPMPPHFVQALGEAAHTTAKDAVRFAVQRIQLRGKSGQVVGTDGRQLLLQGGFRFPWPEDLLVPRLSIFGHRDLPAREPVAVGRTATHLAVRVGRWTFTLAIDADGRFPNVASVVPRPAAIKTRRRIDAQDAELLLQTLPRLPGVREDHAPVTLELEQRPRVLAREENSEVPTVVELPRSTVEGEPLRLRLDRQNLQRALGLGLLELHLVSADTPVLARAGQTLYVFTSLGAGTAVPSGEEPLRIPPKIPAEEPLPAPQERRIDPMPLPPPSSNVHADDGNGERSIGINEIIAEAEELRRLVHDAGGRLGRLIAALKLQRRHSQAIAAATATLRKLKLSE